MFCFVSLFICTSTCGLVKGTRLQNHQVRILVSCFAPSFDGTVPSLCLPLLLSSLLRIFEEFLLVMGGEAVETVGDTRSMVKWTLLPPGFQYTLFAHTLSPCPWYLSASTEIGLRLSSRATDFFCDHVTFLGSGLLSTVWLSLDMSMNRVKDAPCP